MLMAFFRKIEVLTENTTHYDVATQARIHSTSGLKHQVLKLTFTA